MRSRTSSLNVQVLISENGIHSVGSEAAIFSCTALRSVILSD